MGGEVAEPESADSMLLLLIVSQAADLACPTWPTQARSLSKPQDGKEEHYPPQPHGERLLLAALVKHSAGGGSSVTRLAQDEGAVAGGRLQALVDWRKAAQLLPCRFQGSSCK